MTTTVFINGSSLSDAVWFNDVDSRVYNRLASVAGTNTVTATGPASMSAYAVGQMFAFIPVAANTNATTLNITPSGGAALGAKSVYANNAALTGGELHIGVPVLIWYDGTQFQMFSGIGSGQMLGTGIAKAIFWNSQTIAENITVGATQNASSIGPISISSGFAVTVASGGVWKVL